MRCGCPECGTLMIHEEGGRNLCCCCPDCGYRCSACLGTDSVLSREDIMAYRMGSRVERLAEAERLLTEDVPDEPDEPQEQERLWPPILPLL